MTAIMEDPGRAAGRRAPLPAVPMTGPMLVAADPSEDRSTRAPLSKIHVLTVLGRRSLPALIEATVVPAILFYVFLMTVGPTAAMLAALVWSYGAVVRRLIRHGRIPAILTLAVLSLTLRTAIGIMSGTFIYFLQPIAATLALAGVFLGSLLLDRPIIARLAHEFCPLSPEISSRPAIVRLFTGLTVLWAGVHLLTAATTFGLLVSLPTTTFVLLKTLVSLGVTIGAITLTVAWSIRTARSEDLVFARVFQLIALTTNNFFRSAVFVSTCTSRNPAARQQSANAFACSSVQP